MLMKNSVKIIKKFMKVCWDGTFDNDTKSISETNGKDISSGKFVGVTLKEGWNYITKLVEDSGDGRISV